MKQKLSWLDRVMAAVTFAEANEHATGLRVFSITDTKKENGKKESRDQITIRADVQGAEVSS